MCDDRKADTETQKRMNQRSKSREGSGEPETIEEGVNVVESRALVDGADLLC